MCLPTAAMEAGLHSESLSETRKIVVNPKSRVLVAKIGWRYRVLRCAFSMVSSERQFSGSCLLRCVKRS
jgi:hypothetical protein